MHVKTMEGLVGANMNMHLLNTPFGIYKRASQRGDTGTMERALGYVNGHLDQAEEYRAEAAKGMEEESKEVREKAEADRENAVQTRREEQEESWQRAEEAKNRKTDTLEISESGKAVWSGEAGLCAAEGGVSVEAAAPARTKPVIYTKTGEAGQGRPEAEAEFSVLV